MIRIRSGLESSSLNNYFLCASFFIGDFMNDEYYMGLAILEAKKAYKRKEVPVGAIVVDATGRVIGYGYNQKEKNKLIYAHAEIIAIKNASKRIKDWRLNGCSIYTTLEPCPMCASAIEQSRIDKVFYGASRLEKNNKKIIDHILKNTKIRKNVRVDECSNLLTDFFKEKR